MQRNLVIVATTLLLIFFARAGGQSTSEESTRPIRQAASDNYPQRPIKVIVPFGAGGGSDTFMRILQKAIEENDLLPQPIVILNVPGAGGSTGSRQVMESKHRVTFSGLLTLMESM